MRKRQWEWRCELAACSLHHEAGSLNTGRGRAITAVKERQKASIEGERDGCPLYIVCLFPPLPMWKGLLLALCS